MDWVGTELQPQHRHIIPSVQVYRLRVWVGMRGGGVSFWSFHTGRFWSEAPVTWN